MERMWSPPPVRGSVVSPGSWGRLRRRSPSGHLPSPGAGESSPNSALTAVSWAWQAAVHRALGLCRSELWQCETGASRTAGSKLPKTCVLPCVWGVTVGSSRKCLMREIPTCFCWDFMSVLFTAWCLFSSLWLEACLPLCWASPPQARASVCCSSLSLLYVLTHK